MNRTLISALLFSVAALAQDATPKEAPAPAETPAAAKGAHPIPVGKPYLASKEAKLYHRERCKMAQDIKKDPDHMEFTWKAEAEQAGYKACEYCMAPKAKAKGKAKPKANVE